MQLKKRQTATVTVPALDCPDELALIEKGLRRLEGVGELAPDYLNRTLEVEYDSQKVQPPEIAAALTEIGFPAQVLSAAVQSPAELPRLHIATLVGGVLFAVAVLVRLLAGETTSLVAVLATGSAIASGIPVVLAAFRALRLKVLDIHVLMTIAAVGAVGLGDYFEAAATMLLFGVSLWLEAHSMGRARRAVRSLVELAPRIAHRLTAPSGEPVREDALPSSAVTLHDVHPDVLAVGERVLVRPGERIPVDGTILVGSCSVNQAAITGESLPVDKVPGDTVFAGTLNGEGSLEVRVDRAAQQSTLADVARLVQQASASRSQTERFVDKFARRYTPMVILLAIALALVPPQLASLGVAWAATADAWQWFHRALVLLVIACPCALVISTPITIVCGLFRAASRGLLIKGGEHLESAGQIQAIVFDKTGTLTTGEPTVVGVDTADGVTEGEVLWRVAALERHSEHPLARAIVAAAHRRGVPPEHLKGPVTDFSALRGFGVQGTLAGQKLYVGNPRLMAELGLDGHQIVESEHLGATAAMVATEDRLLGTIWLSDPLREDAAEAIAALRHSGVGAILLLSGDRQAVVEEIGRKVGADQVYADLLPEDKARIVQELASTRPHLAMVGDGVNDAPALAAARLGIAFGARASDTALETADIVVMTPKLTRLVELMQLGRRCRWILGQNITLALGVKAGVLLLAALGQATMWMAVATDVGASLIVIFNGMRLLGGADTKSVALAAQKPTKRPESGPGCCSQH